MPERTVAVSLTANASNYIRNMELAANSTKKVGLTAEEAAAKSAESSKKIGTAFLAIGAVAAVGVALAIKEFADFDAKMSQVQSLSHATAKEMDELTQAALNAGQAIGFTADEVADADIELVKAGVSVKDQLGGGLVGTLELAAAGQLDVGEATQIAASAMTQFALKGKDVPAIADALAAGADKALGSVQDLGGGLKFVGPVAHAMGISLNETVGTLALFAQNGIIGEMAGTGLRGVLLSLTSPSKQAAAVMKEYNINLYDATGHFIGLSGVAQQLQDNLGGLDEQTRNQALGQIFSNAQITEAQILMNGGAKTVDKWTAAVNDQGFAAEQASGKMDNLEGDLKKLEAAFQTSVIEAGSGANTTLREIAQGTTSFVGAVGKLPAPLLQAGLQIGTVVAGTGLLVGGFLKAVPAIKSAQATLRGLGLSAGAARTAVGATALAMTGLVIAVTLVAKATADAAAKTAEYETALDQQTGASTKASKALAVNALAQQQSLAGLVNLGGSAYDFAKRFGISSDTVTKAAQGNTKALADFHDQINAAQGNPQYIVDPTYGIQLASLASSVQGEADASKNAKDAINQKNDAERQQALGATSSASANDSAAASLQGVSAAADDASGSVSDLADQITALGKGELDMRAAQRDYEQALDDVTDAVKKNGATLDINTQKGRDNQAALDSIASKATALSAAIVTQTSNQKDATAALTHGRAAYIKAAESMGATASQAEQLADAVGLVPGTVTLQFQAKNLKSISADVDALRKSLGILGQLETEAFLKAQVIGTDPRNGVLKDAGLGHAHGGIIPGRPSGVDNVLVPMATGEGVATAKAMMNPTNRAALAAMNSGRSAAQTYMRSDPGSGGGAPTIIVQVGGVQAGLIASPSEVGKAVTDAVTTAVRNGVVERAWTARN